MGFNLGFKGLKSGKNIRHFTCRMLLLLTVMVQERNYCCVSMERKVATRTLLKCFRSDDNAPVLFVIEKVMG